MKIGVLCPSEIAFRRFMPAVKQVNDISFVGIGVSTISERFGSNVQYGDSQKVVIDAEYKKANLFVTNYGGKIYDGYETMIMSKDIESVYIPLPPALHYKWAKMALENGKHVLVEKPATISLADTTNLINAAKSNHLALHENYMFVFHEQLKQINQIIQSGEIGEVRLYRISFGFPRKDPANFRYNKSLGGGALIDAGGYTIKYASSLLGETAKIICAQMNYTNEFDVDLFGSATMVNDDGIVAQISYGMDNDYKCELEVWGSTGSLKSGRILTAPVGFIPNVTIRKNGEDEVRELSADDSFKKSIIHFEKCITDEKVREKNYITIKKQAKLIDEFKICYEKSKAI